MAPYALSFAVFIVLPIVVAAVLSFMQYDLTAPNATRFVGGQNFKEAWGDEYFWSSMKATLRFTVLMIPSVLVFCLAAALGLNAMSRGRSTVRAMIFLPGMLNVAVAAVLWRWFYDDQFGFFNFQLKHAGLPSVPWISSPTVATPSIVLMSLWWTMGGTCIILLAALQQIPRQIIEAAALDGAGRSAMFRRVVLPLLMPVLLFVVLTNTIGAFQVFGQPFLITNGGPLLMTRGIVQYIYETAFRNYRLGYGAAMSWMLFAVIAVFALIQYRLMRRSLS